MVAKEIVVPAPDAAWRGPARQQVDIPLTPEVGHGTHRVVVMSGRGEDEVGRITILPRGSVTPAKRANTATIPHPLDVRFGEHIRLLGYDLAQTVVEPGGRVELVLYWQTEATISIRYKVFTHLLGEQYNQTTNNFLWGQQDNEPLNGQMPTTTWTPGTIIADPYSIPVAADAPPGPYQIEVGLYGLVDGERLPVLLNGTALDNRVLLTSVEVVNR